MDVYTCTSQLSLGRRERIYFERETDHCLMSSYGLRNDCVKHFLTSLVLPACLGPQSAELLTLVLSITPSSIILSTCQILTCVKKQLCYLPVRQHGVNGLLSYLSHI